MSDRKLHTEPLGRTMFGVTIWRAPGDPECCITWGGPGDVLHLNRLDKGVFVGRDLGQLTDRPCSALEQAQEVIDHLAKIASRGRAFCSCGPNCPTCSDGSQSDRPAGTN